MQAQTVDVEMYWLGGLYTWEDIWFKGDGFNAPVQHQHPLAGHYSTMYIYDSQPRYRN